jgi:general secretion pathway protein D
MVMKKGKCLIFGLLPLTASAALPSASAQRNGSVSEQTKVESVSDVFKVGEEGRVEALAIMNSDPGGVIAVLEQLTGRTALVDSKLPKVKISIGICEPISVPEAIVAIESVLNLNGIATVDMGDKFIKVVPAKSAITQAPAILNESLRSYVPNQNVYSQIITFTYLDAAEFQKRVKSLLTPGLSNSVVFPELNAVLFTDVMSNLQTVEELSQRMDKPVTMVEAVNFLPLVNIKASAVSKKLEQLKLEL